MGGKSLDRLEICWTPCIFVRLIRSCVYVRARYNKKKIFRKYASLGRDLLSTRQKDSKTETYTGREDSEFDKLSSDTLEAVTQEANPKDTKSDSIVSGYILHRSCCDCSVSRNSLGIGCVIIQHQWQPQSCSHTNIRLDYFISVYTIIPQLA